MLRYDEDGSLAKCIEVMKMCVDRLHMAVQTTGGYNFENNRMVESLIETSQENDPIFSNTISHARYLLVFCLQMGNLSSKPQIQSSD